MMEPSRVDGRKETEHEDPCDSAKEHAALQMWGEVDGVRGA